MCEAKESKMIGKSDKDKRERSGLPLEWSKVAV